MSTPRRAPAHALVVFGASGDLTSRKLVPALEALRSQGSLPDDWAFVGVGRSDLGDDGFRRQVSEAGWTGETDRLRWVAGDYRDAATFDRVQAVLGESGASNFLHYLATPPAVFLDIVRGLGAAGLATPAGDDGFARIVIEKPFGRDLASAAELDAGIHQVFAEEQVYRIDHYLGKETVQNVLALRFANAIFEPIWNRRYVNHVQITVAETLGVGHRGEFYEEAGALRDIVQNHLLQVLALTCMEPPASIDAQGIRDEKVKALRAVDILTPEEVPTDVVRAQYDAGLVDGEHSVSYRKEEGVAADSTTETYVAMKLRVDNWRWAGVPFYLRTGKRLQKRLTEVAMLFNDVPHLPFKAKAARGLRTNALILRIQPDEGITLRFGAKVPGQEFEVRSVRMDFSYDESFAEAPHDAYERLLMDAMSGDPTLFIRADEVDQAWRIVDPVLQAWEDPEVPLDRYPAGSWGPRDADLLLARDGRRWRSP
ncbi:MAG TPA: glucose-6-phosphate dehydrogenase [Acidimicrobiales bacterium]|nr:glucose-6-phosphate dehydrogenase [Acidimicrobiales bacterium]